MKKTVIYVHGMGGTANEAEQYRSIFQGYEVIGFDYKACTPWEAQEEFPAYVDPVCKSSEKVFLIANSIGAYFSLQTLSGCGIDKAFLISPIADMEMLILDMMMKSGITEEELRNKKVMSAISGETLSWEYLCYVREHPIVWNIPTEILYGENDNIISYKDISCFAHKINAKLTVMKNGEHWFHTDEQMKFLKQWIRASLP